MTLTLPPKRSPGDVIRSAEHNMLIDALTVVDNRLTTVEAIAGGDTIGFASAGLSIPYGVQRQVQPFSGVTDAPRGLTMPAKAKFKKFYIDVANNTLDSSTTIKARHNETTAIATITVLAGQTGLFSATINDYVVNEGERIDFQVDTTPSTTGNIVIVSMSLFCLYG
jgi:hypothetical protein